MQSLFRIRTYILAVLLLLATQVMAQQGQTLRIVKGRKVTLRADTDHALSYIWFRDGEAINGMHEQRIVVTEGGRYTVMALGDGCNSDLSDPVDIVVDPLEKDIQVDLEIRNLPERSRAIVSQEFNFQLLVLNNGTTTASEIVVTFAMPRKLTYLGQGEGEYADITYNATAGELIWKLPRLAAGEAASQWIRVRGDGSGQAITTARVSSAQKDSNPGDNSAQAVVDIVAIFIPNVITPNGDGKNDRFEIEGLDLFRSNKLLVFNRFGNEVYSSTNYQNDWNGEGLSEGTYFYYLEIEDATGAIYRNKGYVLLMREKAHH